MSTALHTDHYELTMLDASLLSGVAVQDAVFEVFARDLPPGRGYGVVGGVGRLLDALERFRFGETELAWLDRAGFLAAATLDWLSKFRFSGSIDGYREGELFFPGSPVLTVEAPFAEALLLETLVLSVLNFDSAVAGAASRMVSAAGDRPIIEMGGRRTHEEAAVAAARVAWVCGVGATSNLEAGRRYGVPTAGTAGHAFTLAHPDEYSAFAAQVARLGVGTTLLVDTYDIDAGLAAAVAAARDAGASGPGAVRIDSGDLATECRRARARLDELGAHETRIVASGDLDEHAIAALAEAPIDAYGVGTRLVTGSGHPTAELIYKLVAVGSRPVSKRSDGKVTIGGRKRAWRLIDERGVAVAEKLLIGSNATVAPSPAGSAAAGGTTARPLQVALVVDGEVVHRPSLNDARAHHARAKAELGAGVGSLAVTRPMMVAEVRQA